jgi:hypothetical protein
VQDEFDEYKDCVAIALREHGLLKSLPKADTAFVNEAGKRP